ncbi:MAG: hypothetical protein QOE37_1934 [Microbacteriaceae bacterium]|nr:hypothetical protein [Microbacteriaceae bacterium]
MNRIARTERGAASVLIVGLIAVLVLAASFSATLAVVLAARHRAFAGADAAALAAADAALGAVPGIPCQRASTAAAADGSTLVRCRQQGRCVAVEVRLSVLGFAVGAGAVAGPPPRSGGCQPVEGLRGRVDTRVYGVRDRPPPQRTGAVGSREGEGGRPCPAPRSS